LEILESNQYWKLSPERRKLVNKITDELFIRATGVNRKLDWNNDRDLCRQWLGIRDHVMNRGLLFHDPARYDLHDEGKGATIKSGQDSSLQANEAKQDSPLLVNEEKLRSLLTNEEKLRSLGLPAPYKEGGLPPVLTALGVAIDALHGVEMVGVTDALKEPAGEAIAAGAEVTRNMELAAEAGELIELAGAGVLAVAPLVAVLEGLLEIGEAHEAGKTDDQRHCFRTGFAHTLLEGENWKPNLEGILTPMEGYYQQKGKEAALLLRRYTSPEALDSFKKYLESNPVTHQRDTYSPVVRLLQLMGDTGGQQQKPGQQQDQPQQKGQPQQQRGQYTGQGM
jgi:hypothetical protein